MNDSCKKTLWINHPRYNLESVKTVVSSFDDSKNSVLYLLNVKTGKFTFISRSVERVFGYPATVFEEKGLAFFLSIIHPNDHGKVLEEYVACFMAVNGVDGRSDPTLSSLEFRVRHATSDWLWIENNSFLINIEDNTPHVFGTVKGIAERKIKEAFLWHEIEKREKCPEKLKKLAEEYRDLMSGPCKNNKHIQNGLLPFALHYHMLLSNREVEVLKLIANGLSSKQLASELNISTHTVISHRKHLLEKFKVKNTAELIKEAAKSFWID